MTTKKEAKARKEAWRQALVDGRIVRYNAGCSMRSFNTIDEAQAFVWQIKTFCPEDTAEIARPTG